jgi:hypothetical protein
MRLSIYDQFVVGIVRPKGGWSKGRPIAFIEEDDRCVPLFDLLIPNDLDDKGLVPFVSNRFVAFARPGKHVLDLGDPQGGQPQLSANATGPSVSAGVHH